MSRKVMKWLKTYPSAGRLVKMHYHFFSQFLYGGGDEQKSEEMVKS